MSPFQDEPVARIISGPNGNTRKRPTVIRIPVTETDAPEARPVAPETIAPMQELDAARDNSAELKRLRKANADLQRQAKVREDDLRKANRRLTNLAERVRQREASLERGNERLEDLQRQNASLTADLSARAERARRTEAQLRATEAHATELEATLRQRDDAVAALSTQINTLKDTIAQRDATIVTLRTNYSNLYETHTTLVHDLEEGTDRFSKRKEQLLREQVQGSLAQWSKRCQEVEPAPAGHEQVALVNQVNDEMRRSMVDVTNEFQRDLADIRAAMESLEVTRNALRKDLDLWQQGLFVGRYERLARCLQSLDVEIWRTREARLTMAANEDATPADEALAAWDELIDHLQILSEYLKSASECFGLRFFHPQEGEPLDAIRHQAFGATAADPAAAGTVAACVAAGVEAQAGDGGIALLRPALVTVRA